MRGHNTGRYYQCLMYVGHTPFKTLHKTTRCIGPERRGPSENSPSTHSAQYANRGRMTIPEILYAREASAYPRLSAWGVCTSELRGFFDAEPFRALWWQGSACHREGRANGRYGLIWGLEGDEVSRARHVPEVQVGEGLLNPFCPGGRLHGIQFPPPHHGRYRYRLFGGVGRRLRLILVRGPVPAEAGP